MTPAEFIFSGILVIMLSIQVEEWFVSRVGCEIRCVKLLVATEEMKC